MYVIVRTLTFGAANEDDNFKTAILLHTHVKHIESCMYMYIMSGQLLVMPDQTEMSDICQIINKVIIHTTIELVNKHVKLVEAKNIQSPATVRHSGYYFIAQFRKASIQEWRLFESSAIREWCLLTSKRTYMAPPILLLSNHEVCQHVHVLHE